MAKKFYAVKSGYTPGVYTTWDECKKQVDGFPGASYKGFLSQREAEDFLNIAISQTLTSLSGAITPETKSEAIAYVDGSYDDVLKAFAFGIVIFHSGIEEHFSAKMDDPNLLEMRNVAGEIKAAERAMQFCIDNNITSLDIYYDYEGIAKWCTGEWKANKNGTKAYKKFYDGIKSILNVNFIKVKGHSGDKYNDIADRLAKSALGIGEQPDISQGMNSMTANNINRNDLESIFRVA